MDVNFITNIYSEIEQSLAALISDRATDEVLDALTRYRRGLGIADMPSVHLAIKSRTNLDVLKHDSSQVKPHI